MTAEIERFAAELDRAAAMVPHKVGPVVHDTANAIRDDMRKTAPVRTQRLDRTPGPGVNRDSISARDADGGDVKRTSLDAFIGPTYFVSRFLVEGTSRMAPQWNPGAAADPHVERFARSIANAAARL